MHHKRSDPKPQQSHSHHSHSPSHGAEQPESKALRGLLPVLLVAQLMVILDITATNIALPSLATDLHLTGSSISWAITSYSLVFGSLLLFGGRAADLLGRRRLFLTGLTIFTFSSIASALAGTAAALFAARAGQGLGAALLSPAALSIVTSAFQGSQRTKALAAWGAVGGAGAAIGVLVGGLLTELADWRMIFYVNLPVAVALAIAAWKVIPADTAKPQWRGLDIRGAVVATASLASIVYAITQAQSVGWTAWSTHFFGLGGIAGLAAFAALEQQTDAPLVRVKVLADRAVGGGMFLMLAAAGSLFGLFLLCSLYLQNVLGKGPLSTGLSFIPLALAAGAGAHLSSHLIARHGVKGPLGAAFAIATAGLVLLSRVGAGGSYLHDVLPGMLVAGFGLGIAVVTVSISVMTGARNDESGMVSGLNSTGHEIGGTIGIAVFSALAAGAGGAFAGQLAADGIAHAFLIAAHLAAAASVVALIVLPRSRQFLAQMRLNPSAMPVH